MDLANFIITKGKEAGLTKDQISGLLLSASRKLSGNVPEEKWEEQVMEWINKRAQKNIQNQENIESKNVYAENCPADAIREYIEKIIQTQKKYLDEGKEIPEELLIPQEIILSPKNMDFLINSKYVDYIGAGGTEKELHFYWKENDKLPALELKTKRREDGKFILTYIREEAGNGKEEFVWDKDTTEGKKGTIVVSKIQDALEDIYDMDR